MKTLLCVLFFAATLLCQGLPAPSFPPCTFNYQPPHVCGATQYGNGSTDSQKCTWYRDTSTGFQSGNWVTYKTWCESLPGGGYLPIIIFSLGNASGVSGCLDSAMPPITIPGSATGHDLLYMNNATVTYTAAYQNANLVGTYYYWGWQVPTAAIGYVVLSQWVRLDPNDNLLYFSNLLSYSITQ